METLLRDLKFAARGLLRTPGFTLAAVLALALGIGATTAIFSVVHAVLLRSLGWGDEGGLIAIHSDFPGHHLFNYGISPPEYVEIGASGALASVAAYDSGTVSVQGEPAERVRAGFVTSTFLDVLRIAPAYGRGFTAGEDMQGHDQVVLLAAPYFKRHFGGDPSVVGRTMVVDGKPRTVVGVLPESFRFGAQQDLYLPVGWSPQFLRESRTQHNLLGIGRLKRGMSYAGAPAAMAAVTAQIRQANPDIYSKEAAWRISVQPLRTEFAGAARDPLLLLLAAVALVLLIACANVANLLLARSAARSREFAVRAALGAGRSRIVRQLLTESGLLAVAGAALGLALAAWSMEALLASAPDNVRNLAETRLHWPVLAFAAGLCIATTLLFGLAPALRASAPDLASSMKEGAATGSARSVRARSVIIAAQVALSFVLLTATGLVLRSFAHVVAVEPGFDADHVITASLAPAGPAYEDDAALRRYFRRAVQSVRALPGVEVAGGITILPLEGANPRSYRIEGYEPAPGEPQPVSQIRWVEPGVLQALKMSVVAGRDLSWSDDPRAPPVALVNEAWGRRYFPGREIIGRRIELAIGRKTDGVLRTIVGVVRDAHDIALDEAPIPTFYLPQTQGAGGVPESLHVVTRVSGDPARYAAAVGEALRSVDPTQPPDQIRPLEEVMSNSLAPRRFPLQLLGAFAALALILSALGLYGVTAYGVAQRTREIGVRMAVGATSAGVVRLVLQGALRTLLIGLLAGGVASLAVLQLISSQLYGVGPRDPLTYAAIACLLALVALAASGIPALRATKVDPMTALRAE